MTWRDDAIEHVAVDVDVEESIQGPDRLDLGVRLKQRTHVQEADVLIVSGLSAISASVTTSRGELTLLQLVEAEGKPRDLDIALDVRALFLELVGCNRDRWTVYGVEDAAQRITTAQTAARADRRARCYDRPRLPAGRAGQSRQRHADVDERQPRVDVRVGGAEDNPVVGEVQLEALQPVAPDEQCHNDGQQHREVPAALLRRLVLRPEGQVAVQVEARGGKHRDDRQRPGASRKRSAGPAGEHVETDVAAELRVFHAEGLAVDEGSTMSQCTAAMVPKMTAKKQRRRR